MSKYVIDSTTLTATADAIRTKLEDTSTISPLDFAEAILSIEGGGSGGDLSIEYGEFELLDAIIYSNGSEYYEIEMEHKPLFYMCWSEELETKTNGNFNKYGFLLVLGVVYPENYDSAYNVILSYNGTRGSGNYALSTQISDTAYAIRPRQASNYKLQVGTYKWLTFYKTE